MGNGITSIAAGTFYDCAALESIVIPDGVTAIGAEAFFGCGNLESVEIPNSVTSIDDCAFEWCAALTSIHIPESVTSIGTLAFYGCENLASATFGSPSGWIVDGTDLAPSELSEPAKAAEYLRATYADYYWKRS